MHRLLIAKIRSFYKYIKRLLLGSKKKKNKKKKKKRTKKNFQKDWENQ